MTSKQPRLILVHGKTSLTSELYAHLKSAFDLVEVENLDEARLRADDQPDSIIASGPFESNGLASESPLPADIVERVAEGAGVVDEQGKLCWSNQRLGSYGRTVQQKFATCCREAIERFNGPGRRGAIERRLCQRTIFQNGRQHYELAASPATVDPERPQHVTAVVGVIWNVTAHRTLQAKIDAIDAAGAELMRIEPSNISSLNMAERLQLVEEKVVRYVNETLDFDNFEIRLLNRETNQLELVISRGIAPLKVGESMYATPTGNGISGRVAATGQSYICPDVRHDPLYREGLDNAASSLTVPLRLYDEVIGVFNVESYTAKVFNENDLQFAEIFGRYVASAMNILDLLVVERYTTNEELTQNMLGELSKPLGRIAREAAALKKATDDAERRQHVYKIVKAASGMRSRIEACTAGPRSILGAEEEMRRLELDPAMQHRRVLVADDEEVIRETLVELLTQKGCSVTACATGAATIEAIEAAKKPFDLVISDIKMPGRNGYEIFRTIKEAKADTPVILMTGFGYDPNHSIVRASQEGLHSFLFKPFKASQLMDLVEKAFVPAEVK
jgi:CheY-like chemotaxis protein/GAF domain-containing protein